MKAALPTSRPRTKPPEQRRDELMTAAESLFLENGVMPTTIEEITSRAKVAKGTFYLYFQSKEDILEALGERFGKDLAEKIRTAMGEVKSEDWQGKLRAWASACVDGYLDEIRLHDVLFYGWRPNRRGGMVRNVVIDDLTEMLEAGTAAGAWRIGEAAPVAVFLFNGLHAVIDDAYLREKKVNRRRLTEELRRLCFGVLGLPLK